MKTIVILCFTLFLTALGAEEIPLSTEDLRSRYAQAGPEERAEILKILQTERAAAVQARFGSDDQPLTPEERAEAAAALRAEWLAEQEVRRNAVQARIAIHRKMREAMLRNRNADVEEPPSRATK